MINLRNTRQYIEHFLKIRTKDGQIAALKLNEPQRRLYDIMAREWNAGRPVRIIILKARQMGFSTMVGAVQFAQTATAGYRGALVVAHTDEATRTLFAMYRRFYDNLPEQIRPLTRASNAQEILFDVPTRGAPEGAQGLDSFIRCATAGGQGIGRSNTLQSVHLSEFAFWPGDKLGTLTGIMQAVPDEGHTMVVIESTANGYDAFKDRWDAAVEAQRDGREGFIPVFFPWYEMEEYRRTPPPGFERTAQEREIAERYGLDDEQLAWRRWCIETNCGGDLQMFHQEYPATPDEAFLSTGTGVFDQQMIASRREAVRGIAVRRGHFTYDFDDAKPKGQKVKNIRFEEGTPNLVRILREPEEGAPYVIGGDTAGTGSDCFVGQVLDNRTGAQAAVLQHEQDEITYTRQMYCLGMYYNEALIGIETNYSTYPQLELERLGYSRFYVRERVDTYTGKTAQAYGFETTTRTRPLIIDNLKAVARQEIETIGDYETLGEMLTFVYDDHYKPQAQDGEHDDLVMALAIAHFIRPQQLRETQEKPEEGRARWTPDMWEDYRSADAETQKELIKKWGKPRL